LSDYDVVNVGAAGTLVVWKPGSRIKFRAALRRSLPFDAEVAICEGREILRLVEENPFVGQPSRPDVVRFVSILVKAVRVLPSTPIVFPPEGEWLVRIIGAKGRFVFGEYRRHMKTIGYLGQIDKLFGAKITTRNWNTITRLMEIILKRQRSAR
jgi:uncharacterized protein (DUF1697 family)